MEFLYWTFAPTVLEFALDAWCKRLDGQGDAAVEPGLARDLVKSFLYSPEAEAAKLLVRIDVSRQSLSQGAPK